MLTLDQLTVLDAIVRTGSFAGAAERLHRAQSAVSYAIRNLEAALDVTLFDRSGHRAVLTPSGEAVLRQGRDVLARAEALQQVAATFQEGWEPKLTLLLDGLLPIATIMPVLADVQRQGLPTAIRLRLEMLGGVYEAMATEAPALALTGVRTEEVPPGYAVEELGEVVMVPVVAAGHPLAREPRPVPLAALRGHVHLIVSDSSHARMPVRTDLVDAGQRWNFPDLLSRREGLLAGLGFAWMPTYLVEADLAAGRLVPLVLESRNLERQRVGMLRRLDPPLGRMGRLLKDRLCAREILPEPAPAVLAAYTR